MSRAAGLLCILSCFVAVGPARADIAAIRADALPQEASILNAFDDARKLEPYSHSWSQKWTYPVSKEDVAARLGKDLGFLLIALKAHPENSELLLLTGLVAGYAYNLDIEGSHDLAMASLENAGKLVPADFRPGWFRASLLCQTSQPKAGADAFLAIEAGRPWDSLPAAFWDDYMECSSVTGMPAHVLRAADRLDKLNSRASEMRSFLTGIAQKRFDVFDPAKSYEPKEVWAARTSGDFVEFTSTTCGVRFKSMGNWKVDQLGLKNGSCVAYFSTGPYQGTEHELHPSILLLVKQPEAGETLQDFSKRFSAEGTFEPFTASRCPSDACIAMKGIQPGMYGKDGDGHGRIVAFERNQPEFPGLLFEAPWELPKPSGGGEGMSYYRPDQVKARIPGKLYYLIVLDTAASIEEPAMKDLDYFLRDLIAE